MWLWYIFWERNTSDWWPAIFPGLPLECWSSLAKVWDKFTLCTSLFISCFLQTAECKVFSDYRWYDCCSSSLFIIKLIDDKLFIIWNISLIVLEVILAEWKFVAIDGFRKHKKFIPVETILSRTRHLFSLDLCFITARALLRLCRL